MLDIKSFVRKLRTVYCYKVKVEQDYDKLYFEFEDIESASQFAQTCIENCMDTHDGEKTVVSILIEAKEPEAKKDDEKEVAEATEEQEDKES